MIGRRIRGGPLVTAVILVAGCTRSHAAAETGGTAIDVTAGNLISCAAQPSGRVVCWGFDVFARIAENKQGTARPFPIAGLERARQLSLGAYSSLCAVDTDARLRCLGTLMFGNGGRNYDKNFKPEGVAQVASSGPYTVDGPHNCAVRRDGTVLCWGSNGSGQLGTGDLANHDAPVDVAGITNAVEVSAGNGLSCARLRAYPLCLCVSVLPE